MSEIKIKKSDLVWSYISYILQIASGIFLLPIILRKLSEGYLSLWYIFLSITALVNLLDLGLQPTISRNISYIFSGATELKSEGVCINKENKVIDYKLLKSFIVSVKILYSFISIVIGISMFFAGTFYLKKIVSQELDLKTVLLAWNIYTVANILDFYYYTPLLLGCGKIKESNKTLVYSKVAYLIIAYIGLSLNYGIVAVAIAQLISSIVNRISSHMYFYTESLKQNLKEVVINSVDKFKIFRIIWKNSLRSGIAALGGYLAHKSNVMLISLYINVNLVASFGLTYQLVGILMTVSRIYLNTYIPSLNSYRIHGNNEELLKKYTESLFISILMYFIGAIIIIIYGNQILMLIGSKTLLIERGQLILVIIVFLLELNHGIAATLIVTKNKVPYTEAAIFSGMGIFLLSLLLLKYTELGIYSILLAQGGIQLLYNNWKWPYEVSKEFSLNIIELLRLGYINIYKTLIYKKRKGKKC